VPACVIILKRAIRVRLCFILVANSCAAFAYFREIVSFLSMSKIVNDQTEIYHGKCSSCRIFISKNTKLGLDRVSHRCVRYMYGVQVTAVEPSGELNVGLCYNEHTQRLIVSIVEARHLKAASLDNHSPGLSTASRIQCSIILHTNIYNSHKVSVKLEECGKLLHGGRYGGD